MFPENYVDRRTDARSLVWATSSSIDADPELLEIFQYEIDKHATYYGAHNRYPYEGAKPVDVASKKGVLSEVLLAINNCSNFSEKCYSEIHFPFMFCSSTYDWGHRLRTLGLPILPSPWQPPITQGSGEYLVFEMCNAINELCRHGLTIFTDPEFLSLCKNAFSVLQSIYQKAQVRGLILPYTLPPFERFSADYFRAISKPVFLTLHADVGNMSNYVNQQERPVDYYFVFGPEQKSLFEKAGVPSPQLITTGHPLYKEIKPTTIKFSLERPLVITFSLAGAAMGAAPLYTNRSMTIEYLYRVQKVLRKLGVSKARLRCHPAESPEWFQTIADPSFYTIENVHLQEAFSRSSIILGSPSTIMYEAPIYGLNYSVLWPQ